MEELDVEIASKKLREMRESNARDSSTIVELGERIVKKHSHRFGDEFWLICEQVFIAALDVCRRDLAIICFKKLENRFPDSDRVQKLKGMDFEALGCYEDALKIYDDIEKRDPTNAAIRKRRTAILKAEGKISDAIKSLTDYLKTFMADTEAWLELSELYIEELEFNKAGFCMEEVILAQPRNHLFHQRYAEIKYTQGGANNLTLAKDHFAEAVFLSNKTNMRALYGLLLTCSHLQSGKNSEKEEKNFKKYVNWASRMLSVKYQEADQEGGCSKSNTDTTEISELVGKLRISLTT